MFIDAGVGTFVPIHRPARITNLNCKCGGNSLVIIIIGQKLLLELLNSAAPSVLNVKVHINESFT